MFNTIHNILFSHRLDGFLYDGLVTALQHARDHLGPQTPKLLLHLAESELDRIEVGLVGHVEDPSEAQLPHRVLTLVGRMHRQIVHEDAYLRVSVLSPKLRQVLLELLDVHRLREEHI